MRRNAVSMLLGKAFFERTKPPDELLDLFHSCVEVRSALLGSLLGSEVKGGRAWILITGGAAGTWGCSPRRPR